MSNLSNYRKALVALAGVVGQLVAMGVLTGTAATVATAVIAGLTAAGVFAVENKRAYATGGIISAGRPTVIGDGSREYFIPTKPNDAGHSQLDTVLIVLTLCGVALLLYRGLVL